MTNKHMKNHSASLIISKMQVKSLFYPHHEIPLYTLRIATIKIKQKITDISENVDKLETSYTAGENTTEQTLENSLAILQQAKHRITMS